MCYLGKVMHSPADVCSCIAVEGGLGFKVWGLWFGAFRLQGCSWVALHMHTWACTCTSGRRCPLHMHMWAPVPHALQQHAWHGLQYCAGPTSRPQLRKTWKYMLMPVDAERHMARHIGKQVTHGPDKYINLCQCTWQHAAREK